LFKASLERILPFKHLFKASLERILPFKHLFKASLARSLKTNICYFQHNCYSDETTKKILSSV